MAKTIIITEEQLQLIVETEVKEQLIKKMLIEKINKIGKIECLEKIPDDAIGQNEYQGGRLEIYKIAEFRYLVSKNNQIIAFHSDLEDAKDEVKQIIKEENE